VARFIASFFGTGLILRRLRGADAGSGTVGSLFALAASLALYRVDVLAQVAALLATIAASLLAVRPFASTEGDPGWVVIDEAAGTFLATLGLTGIPAVAAWVVFRAADIFKRAFFGVAWAERLPGSVGVTADDLLAGLYGLAVGWAVHALI